jgi:translation initiation factor IF-1
MTRMRDEQAPAARARRERSEPPSERERRWGPASGEIVVIGKVIETLPHGLYRVGIDETRQVTAHAPSGPGRNFVRVLVGDRVRMELSARDLTRGRITAVVRD